MGRTPKPATPTPAKDQIVELFWRDSCHSEGWLYDEWQFDSRLLEHYTIGYVIEWSDDRVSVCQSRAVTRDAIDAVMTIPFEAIRLWRVIE